MGRPFDRSSLLPRAEAARLLLHHVYGGLHNASLALQLLDMPLDRLRGRAFDASAVTHTGMQGITQAVRGLLMLSAVIGLDPGDREESGQCMLESAIDLLRSHGQGRSVELIADSSAISIGSSRIDLSRLVESLICGVAAIDQSPRGSRLRVQILESDPARITLAPLSDLL